MFIISCLFCLQIDSVLTGYRAFYSRSPKRLQELEDLAQLLDEDFVKPQRAEGTRWVEHRRKALIAFDRNYPVVATHLQETDSRGKGDDAAKARGWLRKITTKKFILHIALYLDILGELSHLSLLFQKDSLSIPDVIEAVNTSRDILCHRKGAGPKLKSVQQDFEALEQDQVVYKGIPIKAAEEDDRLIVKCRETVTGRLTDALEHRFSSFSESPVLTSVPVLDPNNWPEDPHDAGVGDKEINLLLAHFEHVLTVNGCNIEEARSEWPRLRAAVAKSHGLQGLNWNALWSKMFSQRKDLCNILHLLQIVQVLPLSTSKVERAFSFMKRIKTDWRVSLDSSTVDDLMIISLEGPPEGDFHAERSVTLWWEAGKQRRRPTVEPYGPRSGQMADDGDIDAAAASSS